MAELISGQPVLRKTTVSHFWNNTVNAPVMGKLEKCAKVPGFPGFVNDARALEAPCLKCHS
jgi:hypothetical protein